MGASTESPIAQAGANSSPEQAAKSASTQLRPVSSLDIIDIRTAAVEINLKDEIRALISPEKGPRKLPTLLLYNERGLQLFEEVNLFARCHILYVSGTNNLLDHLSGRVLPDQ